MWQKPTQILEPASIDHFGTEIHMYRLFTGGGEDKEQIVQLALPQYSASMSLASHFDRYTKKNQEEEKNIQMRVCRVLVE